MHRPPPTTAVPDVPPDFARVVVGDADGLFLFDSGLCCRYVNREAARP